MTDQKKYSGLSSLRKVSKKQETGSLLKEDNVPLHPLLKKVSVIPVMVLNTKPKLFTNRTGEVVGNYTIVKFLGYTKTDPTDLWWEVVCDCGSTSIVNEDFLAELMTSNLNKCIHCYGKDIISTADKAVKEIVKTYNPVKIVKKAEPKIDPIVSSKEPEVKQDSLIGEYFNNFVVVRKLDEALNGDSLYTVKCDCGRTTTMTLKALKTHMDYGRNHCGQCTGVKPAAPGPLPISTTPKEHSNRIWSIKGHTYENLFPKLKMTKSEFDLFFKNSKISMARLYRMDAWIGEEKTNFRIVAFKAIGLTELTSRIAIKCKNCGEITYITRSTWESFDINGPTLCKCSREVWDKPVTKPEPKIEITQKAGVSDSDMEHFTFDNQSKNKVNIGGKDYNHIESAYEKLSKSENDSLLSGICPQVKTTTPVSVAKEIDPPKGYVMNIETEKPKEPTKLQEETPKVSKTETKSTESESEKPKDEFEIKLAVAQLIKELMALNFTNTSILSFVLVNDFDGQFDINSFVGNSNKIVAKFKNLLELRKDYYKIKVNYVVDKINKRILLFISCSDELVSFIDKLEIKLVPLTLS